MDDISMDRMLSGDLGKLPPLPKRVVRLFISSTFTDMTLERNSLMERVYPRLKKYCRERHGLDFQVVDMRWGVRDEATDDHQTVNLCSREIDNCQRVSLGPNFVALIGDKYGFRPLLNKIKSTEYRLLRRCLIESDISTDFLDTWYKEDLNAVPAEYLLQPISSILKNFTNKNEPELQMVDQRIWQAIQERLHDLLLIGSSRLVKQGRMSEREQLLKYSISVTEREVIEGCLGVNDAKSHCLVYVRSIVDLRDHLLKCIDNSGNADDNNDSQHLNSSTNNSASNSNSNRVQRLDSATRKASLKIGDDTISLTTSGAQTAAGRKIEQARRLIGRYIDLTSKEGAWKVDEAAQGALRELKEVKLNSRLALNERNLTNYLVHWNEQDGISLKSDEHKNYLNNLTDHFYSNLTRMIRSAVKSERGKTNTQGLVGEVLQHSHYALQVGKSVHGRSDELDQIRAYILSNQHQQFIRDNLINGDATTAAASQVLPMFLFGLSGAGKTSVLARVATLAHEWVEQARKRRHSSAELALSDATISNSGQQQQQQQQQQQLTGANQTKRWDRKPCIIMRFCCTTPASSSMIGMLTSVCRQLQYNFYQFGPLNGLMDQQDQERQQQPSQQFQQERSLNPGHDVNRSVFQQQQQQQQQLQQQQSKITVASTQLPYRPIPEDFVRLVYTFRQLIDNCRHPLHRRRLFVIIVDSIERLSSPGESSVQAKYSWLTSISQLPQNVRLIVSCSSSGEGSAMYDYLHLKRHFLLAHHRAIKKLNSDRNYEYDFDNNNNTDNCDRHCHDSSRSGASSESGSLELDLSTSDDETDSVKLGDVEAAPSCTNGSQQSKYGRLLKGLVLPAVRLKRCHFKGHPNASSSSYCPTTNGLMKPLAMSQAIKFAPPTYGDRLGNEWSSPVRMDTDSVHGQVEALTRAAVKRDQHQITGNNIGQRCKYPATGLLHIRPLGKEMAANVLRRWLDESGRNLTEQQWSIVERSFAHCSRPIFVKLAFGEVINWKSYSTQGDTKGLTFGSAWLADMTHARQMGANATLECAGLSERDQLLRLVQEFETTRVTSDADDDDDDGNGDGDGDKFKWQMLAMEQQWLNFVEYRSRADQQASPSSVYSAPDGSGNLVIRIGNRAADLAGDQNRHQLKQTGSSNNSAQAAAAGGLAAASSSMSICHLSDTIEDAICQLFARIELQHGYLLTKHSLSYITAARNGICENELEDILSLDDVVLDDVFQYHLPPVRRIPPLLWTRIRNDLPDYLSERDADGIVITWHHNQFKTVTEKRYLNESKQVVYIHSLLADYFLGKWAGKAKPFRCTRQQIQLAAEQLESAVQQSMHDSQQATSGASSSFVGGGGGGGGGGGVGGSKSGGRLGSGSARSGTSFSVRNRLRSSDQHDQRLQWAQAKAHRQVPHQPLFYDTTAGAATAGAGELSSRSQDRKRGDAALLNAAANTNDTGTNNFDSKSKLGDATLDAAYRRERRVRYNLRKLTELPHHLLRSGRFNELATCVLFNYKWLLASIDALGLQSLFADLDEAQRCLEGKLIECHRDNQQVKQQQQQQQLDLQLVDCVPSDELEPRLIESMLDQLSLLASTLRLSASVIHSNARMLAPQLIGRLVSVVDTRQAVNWVPTNDKQLPGSSTNKNDAKMDGNKLQQQQQQQLHLAKRTRFLAQLIQQCDKDGCSDCSLLPTDHCLQSPDGLQLSSLEGHPFAVMSMVLASDQRHLLAISSKFIMWNISTGEIAREIDPKLSGSIMKDLVISLNNQFAIAYTSDNTIIVLDILTQQVVKYEQLPAGEQILGLKSIDSIGASRFLVWTAASWLVLRLNNDRDGGEQAYLSDNSMHDKSAGLKVTLDHKVNCCDCFPKLAPVGSQLVDVEVKQDTRNEAQYKLFAIVSPPLERGNLVQLITVDVVLNETQLGTIKSIKLWTDAIQAAALALSPSCKQLIYSTASGNICLVRRRATCWSRPKVLTVSGARRANTLATPLSFSGSTAGLINGRDSCPLAIEIDTGMDSAQGNQSASLIDDSELNELASFERKIDKITETEETIGATTKIFDLITDNNNNNEKQSRKSVDNCVERVRFVKLYWPNCITVLQLDCGGNDYNEKCLVFPRDIRNVCIGNNKCQLSSVIMSTNCEQDCTANASGSVAASGRYLIVAATKKLLVYSIEHEQLLKCIDAHGGRITKLLSIGHSVEAANFSRISKETDADSDLSALGGVDSNNESSKSSRANAHRSGRSASRQLSVASSSLDRTVKIWNLLNIAKEGQLINKLDSGQIDFMCVCSQRPLVTCLARGQLSIWDWRTMKIVALFKSSDEIIAATVTSSSRSNGIPSSSSSSASSFIIRCKFSSNGRHLAVATMDTLLVLAIENGPSEQQSTGRLIASEPKCTDRPAFKLVAKCSLPGNGLVVQLKFIGQDSRIVAIQQCSASRKAAAAARKNGFSASPPRDTVQSPSACRSESASSQTTATTDDEFRLTYELIVSCHSLTDSRLQYSIDCQVPKCKNFGEFSGQVGSSRADRHIDQIELIQAKRHRLAAITCDQQFVVIIGNNSTRTNNVGQANNSIVSARRRSTVTSCAPLQLNVFSTRDGSLVRSVDLQRLQTVEYQLQAQQDSRLSSGRRGQGSIVPKIQNQPTTLNAVSSNRHLGAHAKSGVGTSIAASTATSAVPTGQLDYISITNDQFNRIKSIDQGERQTSIALIDDERGLSFIVDVGTKLLVSHSNLWSGKLSSDGRYGLSRMFASSSSSPSSSSAAAANFSTNQSSKFVPTVALSSASKASLEFSSGGLRLLEMRRCQAVKSLLTIEQLNQLHSESYNQAQASDRAGSGGASFGGSSAGEHDTLCGFTRPNDAYVYYCDLRLKRLILVRVRDSQLIANYKLSSSITSIKCSSDGYALILAQTDGSLTSLAIVDPQTSDTLARLAQYPSRRRLN